MLPGNLLVDFDKKQKLDQLHQELTDIEFRREQIMRGITRLESDSTNFYRTNTETVNWHCNISPAKDKIKLFRSLFRGREDVYPRRFESMNTGRSGY